MRSLEGELEFYANHGALDQVGRRLADESMESHVASVVLAGPDGKVTFSTSRQWLGRDLAEVPGVDLRLVEAAKRLHRAEFQVADRTRYLLFLPLDLAPPQGQLRPGAPSLLFEVMDFQEELRWTRAQALPSVAWFALGGLAFAGLLGFFLIHRINRRMERLQAAFTTLGSGDYSARSHLEGQDELADLGRHFDAMMVRLQAGLAARAQDEAQLRATFTHLPIGLGRLSLEGAIQAVNPAFERSVALAEADLLGKDFRDFLIEGDRDVFTRIQTRCSREGLPVHEEELRWRRGDGTLAWLAVTLVHLPGFGGMSRRRCASARNAAPCLRPRAWVGWCRSGASRVRACLSSGGPPARCSAWSLKRSAGSPNSS
jgi:PAS domain S-box-containing protein